MTPLASAPERVKIARAAEITGENVRTLQALAAAGRVPGAAKLSRNWTFDIADLRIWIRRRKAETCQNARRRKTATGAGPSYGGNSRSVERSSDGAYEQTMRQLRNGGLRPGGTGR